MTKRYLTALLAVILMLSVFITGCTGTGDGASKPQDVSGTDSSADTASSEAEASEPEASEPVSEIPEYLHATGTPGEYTIEGVLRENASMAEISASGDTLVMQYVNPGLDAVSEDIVIYSLADFSVIGSISLPESLWNVQALDDGSVFVCDMTTAEISVYAKDGTKAQSYKLPTENGVSKLAASGDGKSVVYSDSLGTELYLYNSADESSTLLRSGLPAPKWMEWSGSVFCMSGRRQEVLSVDPALKTLDAALSCSYANLYSGECLVEQDTKRFLLTYTDDTENPKQIPLVNSREWPELFEKNCLVTTNDEDGKTAVRIYDIGAGIRSSLSLESPRSMCVTGDGRFIVALETETGLVFRIFYLAELEGNTTFEVTDSEEPIDIYDGIEMPEFSGSDEMVAYANRLLTEYGVRVIYTAENLAEFMVYPGFSGVAVTEDKVIAKLSELETVMKTLPEGMIREVSSGRELWIYLGTGFVSDELNVAGAVVSGLAMALDVEYAPSIFRTTFMHEMCHFINKNIDHGWQNLWIYLMPEEMREEAYYDSYTAQYDSKYTQYDYANSEVWFYDNYARTFSDEDRARIFENLYASYEQGQLVYGLDFDGIRKKARYYCTVLRANLDCCRDADVLPWELYLGEIDMHEFDNLGK